MNSRIKRAASLLLASAEGQAWQARLTDCFYDAAAKRATIDEIQRGLAGFEVPTLAGAEDRVALAQAVIQLLVAEAFRTAPPPDRPASAEPSLSTGVELQDLIIDHYPSPIATPYRAFVEQHSPTSAFGCLLDTFEGLLHYLATVAVSSYFRAGLFDEHCNRILLEKFLKQEWGAGDLAWLLDQTVRYAGDCHGKLPYAELPAYLFTDRNAPSASHQVLEALVSLRNRVWAHGTGRSDDFFQPLLEPHRKLLETELARMAWLTSWELIRPSVIDEHGVVREADLLMGERLRSRRQYDLALARDDLEPDGAAVRVGHSLLLVDSARRHYLPLFPLALFHFELSRQGTYFLQRLRWNAPEEGSRLRKAVYVAYDVRLADYEEHAGDPAVASLETWVKRLQSRFPEAVVKAELPASAEARDPDYELAEVHWEQNSHLRGFAGREADLEAITRWLDAQKEGAYLLVLGPPGQGKSALIAELAHLEAKRAGCLLHMIKSHRHPLRFVPSLISQASRLSDTRFGADAYRGDLEDLRNALVGALQKVCKVTGQATLFVDALDELDANAHRLEFLPTALAPGLRVVLSCRPDIPLVQDLRARLPGLKEYSLEPLGERDFPMILQRRLGSGARVIAAKIDLARLFQRLQGNALLLRRALDRLSMALESPDPDTALATFDVEAFPNDLDSLFADIYNEIAEKRAGPSVSGADKAELLRLLTMARQPIGLNELSELMGLAGRPLSLEVCRDRLLQMSQYLLDTGSGRFKPWHQGLTDFVRTHILGESGCRQIDEVFSRWLEGPAGRTSYGLLHRCGHLLAVGRNASAAALLLESAFLEDKAEAGLVLGLLEEYGAVLGRLSTEDDRRPLLCLLLEALRADLHFIMRHPQLLFQCLWNRGWWFDAPDAARYYTAEAARTTTPALPWNSPGPKFSSFLESWSDAKEKVQSGFRWLKSRRPPLDHLGGAQVAILSGHEASITSLDVSGDGRWIASTAMERTVRMWDAQTGEQIFCYQTDSIPYRVAFSGDDSRFTLNYGRHGPETPAIEVRDTATGSLLQRIEQGAPPGLIEFSRDRSSIAYGREVVRVCDAQSGETRFACELGDQSIEDLRFSRQGDRLLAISTTPQRNQANLMTREHTLWLFDAQTGNEIWHRTFRGLVNGLAVSPDGNCLAMVTNLSVVTIWDAEKGTILRSARRDNNWLEGVAYSPDSQSLVTGGDSLIVWEAATAKRIRNISNQFDILRKVIYMPDGKRVVAGGDDNTIRIWDTASNGNSLVLQGHKSSITDLAFLPGSTRLISCGVDERICIWDVATGIEIQRLECRSGGDFNCWLSAD